MARAFPLTVCVRTKHRQTAGPRHKGPGGARTQSPAAAVATQPATTDSETVAMTAANKDPPVACAHGLADEAWPDDGEADEDGEDEGALCMRREAHTDGCQIAQESRQGPRGKEGGGGGQSEGSSSANGALQFNSANGRGPVADPTQPKCPPPSPPRERKARMKG